MLWFMWLSIVFAPMIELGPYLRIDQIIFPIFFLLSMFHLHRQRTNSRGASLIVGYALASVVLSLYGGLVTGEMNWQFIVKWPALFIFNMLACYVVIWWSRDNREELLRRSLIWLQITLFISGGIGMIQVLEHRRAIPWNACSYVLNQFYPYYGELDDNNIMKANGYQLRTGGAGRLTSVFDGHPILAGDFLAIGLIFTLPLARGFSGFLLAAVPTFALMLTLSRGSVLSWCVGIASYLALLSMRRGSSARTIRVLSQIMFVLIGLVAITLFTPFGSSILWRIEGTIETMTGMGVEDGRTDKVWPVVFAALERGSLSNWLFGLGRLYDGPTDSQYLFTLINAGLVGIVAIVIFHLLLARMGYRYSLVAPNEQQAEFGLAFAAAMIALLAMFTLHPAMQNRRLISTIFTLTILIPHQAIYLRRFHLPGNSHDRSHRAPHNGAPSRRRAHSPQGMPQPVAERV